MLAAKSTFHIDCLLSEFVFFSVNRINKSVKTPTTCPVRC